MEKTHGYKSWLDVYESTVYCGEDRDYAYKFLTSVVLKIMNTKYCTMLDLIDLDCNIHRSGVKQVGYGAVHGWTEDQIQRMHVATGTLGYYVWLGQPVNLDDRKEEKKEMKITKVIQQPERPLQHCYECKYFKALVTQYPCCDCAEHSKFVLAKKENKGEKEMNDYEEDLTEIDRNSIIPKRIWFNEHDGKFYTTVEWEDGTKTTVAEENKEHASQYGGFTAALAKRMFGTGNSIYLMNKAIDKANERKKLREKEREEERIRKQKKREADAANRKFMHEMQVREAIEKLQVENEAQKRFRDERFQTFARELLGLNTQKKMNSNGKTAKEESAE